MAKDIQFVVAVFVHLSLASVLGLNVAIAASAITGERGRFTCTSCLAAATMVTGQPVRPVKTAALATPLPR